MLVLEAHDPAGVFDSPGISSSSWAVAIPSGVVRFMTPMLSRLLLAHGERRLLTFNEADFRRFATLIEVVTP